MPIDTHNARSYQCAVRFGKANWRSLVATALPRYSRDRMQPLERIAVASPTLHKAIRTLCIVVLSAAGTLQAQDVSATGILRSTTFAPSGVPTSEAVHPFTIKFRADRWNFKWSDEAVSKGTKMGPEYVEAAFDGSHLFSKVYYTAEMQQRMQDDPGLKSLVQKNAALAQAKEKFDVAMKSGNPLLRPMNTNSESGYVDKTSYPRRLAFAGRTLWLGLISCRGVKESEFALPDVFDSGRKSNWKATRVAPNQLALLVTNQVPNKMLEMMPSILEFDITTNILGSEFITGFRLVKYFPGNFKGPTPVFHECRVSNLAYSIVPSSGDLLPTFSGLAYVEDHRFGNGAIRYVSSNGAFMTPNTAETKSTLQEIKTNQLARRRLKPMSKSVAVLWAAMLFIPLFLIAYAVRRTKQEKHKPSE